MVKSRWEGNIGETYTYKVEKGKEKEKEMLEVVSISIPDCTG
jgi:hypothetical protein